VTKKAQAENDMTKTLVAVVLMFISCQLLNPLRNFITAFLPVSSRGCGSFYFYFRALVAPAIALDASSHFFVYSLCNKRFNEKLSQKWRRLWSSSQVSPTPGPQNTPPADPTRPVQAIQSEPTLPHGVNKDLQLHCSTVATTVV